MLTNAMFWYICLIVYGGASLWSWYKAFRKKRLKYALKQQVNGLRGPIIMIWFSYFIIGAVSLIPPMLHWINEQTFTTQAAAVWRFAPSVYLLTVIYIAFRVIRTAWKTTWKYTAQEQEWERESALKFKTKVKSFLPSFLKRFIKTEATKVSP